MVDGARRRMANTIGVVVVYGGGSGGGGGGGWQWRCAWDCGIVECRRVGGDMVGEREGVAVKGGRVGGWEGGVVEWWISGVVEGVEWWSGRAVEWWICGGWKGWW